ncbi:MAG: cation:proton antiporter [Dethiobacter sp.]|jgi:Kef-type K+ transport system membrane component KefB|nr:cation:proton antiporter [Dethiobacter sp.]
MTIYDQALGLAILLLAGYLGGRVAKKINMPMVAGYVIAGLLLGPSILNVIPEQLNTEFNLIKVLGLGIIALVIGGELEIEKIKSLGKDIFVITVVKVLATFVIVFFAMRYLLNLSLPISLLLGATSTASAPGSPMAIIREYRAKGPFTTTLLGVVATTDAVCIFLFVFVSAFARMIMDGLVTFSPGMFLEAGVELLGSFGVGIITALLLAVLFKYITDKQHRIAILVGIALLNSGVANMLHFSPVLTNMTAGFVFTNVSHRPQSITVLNEIEFPIYVVFFALAGASLHLDILLNNWWAALVYIVARGIGKVGGAFMGARLSGAPEKVQKYLGFSMFSKAGLTIGLVLIIQGRFPEIALIITAIELAAVTVSEALLGPLGTKYALISSGETQHAQAKI